MLGPYNEGAKVILQCETQGGYPEPVLTWWRDGKLVDDSYEILLPGQSSGVQARAGGGGGFATTSSQQVPPAGTTEEDGSTSSLDTDEQATVAIRGDSQAYHLAGGRAGSGSSTTMNEEEHDNDEDELSLLPPNFPASSSQETLPPAKTSQKQLLSNKLIRNKLELIGLTRADLFANYLCQAWNTKLSEPPSTSIMIDMNRK